jgi:diaminohydroxyphosphoribosylaminopyrimidine deaminase/5-amino-6-(5-phosphoribosylamino)uracil reductase
MSGGAQADPAATACWRALCLLAERIRSSREPVRSCWLRVGDPPAVLLNSGAPPAGDAGDGWSVLIVLEPGLVEAGAGGGAKAGDGAAWRHPPAVPGESRYVLEDLVVLRPLVQGGLPAGAAALLETYAPYCLAAAHARKLRRACTVSHFAQSLDGRIATGSGDSKWIGCAENLLHAHRMRALCDGVLIGARTLRRDRPALTVRQAEGEDPARIVVGAAGNGDIASLLEAGPGRILLIGDGEEPESPQVERLALPRQNGRIATALILEELYRRDIFSVYVEGGSVTTSAFLADRTLDVLQLHISPLILGGGIPSFSQPEIRAVAESVRFATHAYRSVGDGILFVGRVAPCEPSIS